MKNGGSAWEEIRKSEFPFRRLPPLNVSVFQRPVLLLYCGVDNLYMWQNRAAGWWLV